MNKTSLITKAVKFFLRLFSVKEKLNYQWWTKATHHNTPPAYLSEKFSVQVSEINKNPVWTINSKNSKPEKVILYLHGGGYSKGFMSVHWKMIAFLTEELNYTVIAPDYPISGIGRVNDVFEMLHPLYQDISIQYGPENIIIMGDSAGGGLAHAFSQELVELSIDQPSQIILLCPWLDITLSNPLIDDQEEKDLILKRDILQQLGKEYSGELDSTHYRVSPIYGKLRRLAPTTIFTGSDEILQPDCKKLRLKAESEPVVFNYREFKGMFHNWMFFNLPESKTARRMIINQIKDNPSEAEEAVNAQKHFWKV